MGLAELQRVVDDTLRTASPLARRVYDNGAWSAGALQRFINRVMAATVATVREDGRPHASVVLVACLDGTVFFAVSGGSMLGRNLDRRATLALTVIDQHHDVTIHGTASRVGRATDAAPLVQRLHDLSRRGRFTPRNWDGDLWAVRPERIFLSR